MLTNEQIDALSGRELDAAICVAHGWRIDGPGGKWPGWWVLPPEPYDALGIRPENCHPQLHDDIGDAFVLLASMVNVKILIMGKTVEVCDWSGDEDVILSSGYRCELATVLCRAYLKIKLRAV